MKIQNLSVDGGHVHISDQTRPQPFHLAISSIALKVKNFGTASKMRAQVANLSMKIDGASELEVRGSFGLSPLRGNLALKLRDLPVSLAQPYVTEVTTLQLHGGWVDLDGKLLISDGVPWMEGDVQVKDLKLKSEKKSVLKWKALAANGVRAHLEGFGAQSVVLQNLSTDLTLKKDGQVNWREYFPQSEKKETPARPFAVAIQKFQLVDGRVLFTDQQIQPSFQADIHRLNGDAGPIVLQSKNKVALKLKGQVGNHGTAQIEGSLRPFAQPMGLNVDARFANLEMTTLTPYSGHFAGYEIKKGKLFLDLNYLLKERKIRGKNSVLLDQFRLGERVPGKETTDLPIKLAISLLKDSKGQIHMNLPVEGDVDQPSFSLAGLIGSAFTQVIANVVLSPFRFLGSLFGGEDLESIAFPPGSSKVLDAKETKKLDSLAKALLARPELQLEIQGRHGQVDEDFLRDEKLAKTRSEGAPLSERVEEDLQKSIQVSRDKLRQLSLSRAKWIQTELIRRKVPATRVYVLSSPEESQSLSPGEHSRSLLKIRSN